MHLELGIGQRTIYFCNPEKDPDVDAMLTRIATAYSTMLCMGYPEINRTYRQCKMIFTSVNAPNTRYSIAISTRPCGIYTADHAFSKQIARQLHALTGITVKTDSSALCAVEIGLGNLDIPLQGYVLLKDAILSLPGRLF